ncbi:recombinase RecT [Tsukamurella sputi]|nr:recombinase RecT [Tsukamurella sputi]
MSDQYQPVGQQLAPRQQPSPMQNLQGLIRQMAPEMQKALPKHMTGERMARIATTVLRQTPKLAECTPESFLGALLTAAQLGLEPGPLGEAYLVPYGRTVTFIPGYRGLIKLAWQSGQLQDIHAQVVYENDEFDYRLGLHRDLVHVPARGDRGKAVYVYAAAVMKDGGTAFEVMSVGEVEAIRARSRSGNNGPWKTDWSAMARKTAVKQLAKWLPSSVELRTAVALDETARDGTDRSLPSVVDVSAGPELDLTPETPAIDAASEDVEAAVDVPAEPKPQAAAPAAKKATKVQIAKVEAIAAEQKFDAAFMPEALANWTQRDGATLDDLTSDEANQIISIFTTTEGK